MTDNVLVPAIPDSNNDALARRIHRLVQGYVMTRTERKSGLTWDSFKGRKIIDGTGKERMDVPEQYRKAREAIATQAFLRVRACRSRQDFVDFFAGTLCSVPQFLPQKEYDLLALALLDQERWEDAKSLTMLALSATSRV